MDEWVNIVPLNVPPDPDTASCDMVCNRCMEFNLLGVKVIYLIDRTELFRVGGLVLGGETVVTDLYSSLEGQRAWENDTGT
jgi:hypothetical protein